MPYAQWLALAAITLAPVLSVAQEKASPFNPADSAAPGSSFKYESAFKSYVPMQEDSNAPDKVWRAANEEMGSLGGHAGHIKNSGTNQASKPAASEKAPAATASQPAPKSVDHSGHGMQH